MSALRRFISSCLRGSSNRRVPAVLPSCLRGSSNRRVPAVLPSCLRGSSNRAIPAVAAALAFFLALAAPAFAAVPLLDTYYSPKNAERPVRSSTRFIILHTTEGAARGAGTKLQKNGEAHYMVDEAGRIYRIIDRKRVAYHCGRSMWNGLSSLDNYAIGIEVVGFHNKDPNAAQCKAIKSLLAELKKVYKVPDDRVLTHSMVAYGAPNQWHKRSHRGRKRCAMRMALPSVRRKLGLNAKPSYDPDVKAGRLVVADQALQKVLYSVEKKSAKGGGKGKTPAKPQPAPAQQPKG
ncbi:MAG: N-acetylmuramoyl-L-alanine amidase, partial [Kiritimatiellae bacterium]|nr:N-acetylmuramoyl-L-alanine amidase [Kiritimatiellia bacterium]